MPYDDRSFAAGHGARRTREHGYQDTLTVIGGSRTVSRRVTGGVLWIRVRPFGEQPYGPCVSVTIGGRTYGANGCVFGLAPAPHDWIKVRIAAPGHSVSGTAVLRTRNTVGIDAVAVLP